jgi:hypothetical protein
MKLLWIPVALLCIGLASQGLAAQKNKVKKTDTKAPASTAKIIASCDVPEVGTCLDFTDKGKEKSETLCASLQKKPEAKACSGDFSGACEFSDGYFRRFYKAGAAAWPVKDAQNECKEKGGTWH